MSEMGKSESELLTMCEHGAVYMCPVSSVWQLMHTSLCRPLAPLGPKYELDAIEMKMPRVLINQDLKVIPVVN
jgi:hypothetical protein